MGFADKFKDAVSAVKDTGAGTAIRTWLSREMADYGEVLDFKINSRERTAELHVLLKGEREPLTIQIGGWELTQSGTGEAVMVTQARASREWVNAVLRKFVIGQRHAIPAQYSGMVKMVLNG